MPWVEVNGVDIYYMEDGDGPPLVFLHGNSSCGEAWFQQFAVFRDRFRVIAYDSVNHGHSANSPRDADEPDRADELEGFLAVLDIERPFLAGNSMGGNTILRWAARHPSAAAGLVISGSGVRSGADAAPPERDPLPEDRLYVPVGDSFTPEFKERDPVMLERYYRIRSTATRLEALRHPRRPSERTREERIGLIDRVASIESPMQIIAGDLDRALEAAQMLHERVPASKLHVIPGGPHNAYWEMPEAWNPPVAAFLDSVRAGVAAS